MLKKFNYILYPQRLPKKFVREYKDKTLQHLVSEFGEG